MFQSEFQSKWISDESTCCKLRRFATCGLIYNYVEWNGQESEEELGWYHCIVKEYKLDGVALVAYSDSVS